MPQFVTQRALYEIRERPSKTYSWKVSLSVWHRAHVLQPNFVPDLTGLHARSNCCRIALEHRRWCRALLLLVLPVSETAMMAQGWLSGFLISLFRSYSIGLYRNAQPTDSVHERGAQMFLLVEAFLWFTSTFAQMVIAAIPTAETGGNIGNLIFSLSVSRKRKNGKAKHRADLAWTALPQLIFCGVLVQKPDLGWWIVSRRICGGNSGCTTLIAS